MAHSARSLTAFAALTISAAAAEVRSIHFRVFSLRPVADAGYIAAPGEAVRKVLFYPTARSPRYDFEGSMPLRIVDVRDNHVFADVQIPADVSDALLLFTAEASDALTSGRPSEARYHVDVVDDGAARRGPGGVAIINLSRIALSGTIGPHAVTLRAGLNPTLQVGTKADIALRAAYNGRTYQSFASSVELGRTERALLLLFPPFYPGSLEVQSRLLVDEPSKPTAAR